jgi:hypothetical protein
VTVAILCMSMAIASAAPQAILTLPSTFTSSTNTVYASTVSANASIDLVLLMDVSAYFAVLSISPSTLYLEALENYTERVVAGPQSGAIVMTPTYAECQNVNFTATKGQCILLVRISSISSVSTAFNLSGFLVSWIPTYTGAISSFDIKPGYFSFFGGDFSNSDSNAIVNVVPGGPEDLFSLTVYKSSNPLQSLFTIDANYSSAVKTFGIGTYASVVIVKASAENIATSLGQNMTFQVEVSTSSSSNASYYQTSTIFGTLGAACVLVAVSIMFAICMMVVVRFLFDNRSASHFVCVSEKSCSCQNGYGRFSRTSSRS